jgi:hypothetical protein
MMRTVALALSLGLAGCTGVVPATAPEGGRVVDNRTDYAQRLLDLHNAERTRVGLAPLAWSVVLSEHARRWAEELARTNEFMHSTNDSRPGEGENLFRGTAGAFPLERMVGHWLDERSNFKPGTFPAIARSGDWTSVGHYSQIVWPATREVGCGLAVAKGMEYLVCRYSPPGNVRGQKVG